MELKEIKSILTEDEFIAVEILQKAGWQLFFDVDVEKAGPLDERWPLYTEGGLYKLGILRKYTDKQPPGPKKKRGRPKKK